MKVDKCIFLGYVTNFKGYKCYNPITKAFYVNKDVIFDEGRSWFPWPTSRGPEDIICPTINGSTKNIVMSEQ